MIARKTFNFELSLLLEATQRVGEGDHRVCRHAGITTAPGPVLNLLGKIDRGRDECSQLGVLRAPVGALDVPADAALGLVDGQFRLTLVEVRRVEDHATLTSSTVTHRWPLSL